MSKFTYDFSTSTQFFPITNSPNAFFKDSHGNVLLHCISKKTSSGGVTIAKPAFEYILNLPIPDDRKFFRLDCVPTARRWEGTIGQLPRHFNWRDIGRGEFTIVDEDMMAGWKPSPAAPPETIVTNKPNTQYNGEWVGWEPVDLPVVRGYVADNSKYETMLRFVTSGDHRLVIDQHGLTPWRKVG